jgi:hypothetical protein
LGRETKAEGIGVIGKKVKEILPPFSVGNDPSYALPCFLFQKNRGTRRPANAWAKEKKIKRKRKKK